ncbi:hypothetical protein DL98DRAFT_566844 [Cadophora sp. DSE1049]|nr:hypothetical protein DL98DRAFT_566844 [Cadophora sp. DSE1049]
MDSAKRPVRHYWRHRNKASKAKQGNSTPNSEQTVTEKPLGFLDLPYGIVPAVNRYRRRLRRDDKPQPGDGQVYRKYSVYRYQWDGHPQKLPQWSRYCLPTRDGTTAEVYTEQTFYISGFNGIRVLRTRKKVRDEGTEVLYGHNKFYFDADGCHGYRNFKRDAGEVPGAPLPDGTLPNENQISEAIVNLLNKKFRHCRSVWYDAFLRFCVAIGPYNAARLKSVDITGTFEVAYLWHGAVSFASILPVYTTIMSRVCHNLTKITVHKNTGDDSWGHEYDEDDYDENGIEIEGSCQLQPGGRENGNKYGVNAQSSSGLYMDEGWGTAMKWVQFVEDRTSGIDSSNQDTAVSGEDGDVEEIHGNGKFPAEDTLETESSERIGCLADQLASSVL